MEKFSDSQVIPGYMPDFEIIVVAKGGLFLHGLKDCVISTSAQLIGTGEGTFMLLVNAKKCKENVNNQWIDYSITSADYIGVFSTDLDYKDKTRPSKLGDFLMFLEGAGEINVKIPNHKLTRSADEEEEVDFTIEPEGDAVYKLTTTFPRSRAAANAKNAGAMINFEASKCSPHTEWIQHFTWGAQLAAALATKHTNHAFAKVHQGPKCTEAIKLWVVRQEADQALERQYH